MIIESQVTHFLNTKGLAYFPQWFEETSAVLQTIDGFISIHYETNSTADYVKLKVRFENDSLRRQWATSERHQHIVGKLDLFRTQPYTVVLTQ